MRSELGLVALSLSLCLVGATACETQHHPSSFASSDSMRAQPVTFGDVVSIRQVDIRPGQTHLGMATGAALGALAGSQLGRNASANAAGGIGGAVVGSQAGSAIQGSQVSRGIEVSVTMEDGQTVAIIQPGDPRDFRVGDRVRIVGTSDNARVAH
jgi:outer membrane lipoprotein SlyB